MFWDPSASFKTEWSRCAVLLLMIPFLTDRKVPDAVDKISKKTVQLDASTVEIEERGVKLRLTVVDTPGFGDAIDNTDSFQQIIRYLNSSQQVFWLRKLCTYILILMLLVLN